MLHLIFAFLAADLAQMDEAKPVAASDPDKQICRMVGVTGSIMDKRVCHARAQWKKIDQETERAFENRSNNNTMDRSQGGAGGGTDSFGQKGN